jgi:hypothetical protein
MNLRRDGTELSALNTLMRKRKEWCPGADYANSIKLASFQASARNLAGGHPKTQVILGYAVLHEQIGRPMGVEYVTA